MCSLCLSCLQASFNNWLLPGKTLLLWNPPRRLQSIANGSASAAGSHRFPWCGGWFWLLPFVWKSWDPTVCGGTKQKENDENIQEAILCLFFQGFWGQLDRPLVLFSGCVDSMCRCPDAQARSFDVFKASIPATSDHSWPLNFWHFRNSHLKLFSELTWSGMIPSFFLPGNIIQWTCAELGYSLRVNARGQGSRSRPSSAGQGSDRRAMSLWVLFLWFLLLFLFFFSFVVVTTMFCEATKGPAAQVTQPAESELRHKSEPAGDTWHLGCRSNIADKLYIYV